MFAAHAQAADPVDLSAEVPMPPAKSATISDGTGIWGAIAWSATDKKSGMFWGGDTREEAEANALKHCTNAAGADCQLVETFRNHRHWNDDDGLYPYNYCAVLAVDPQGTNWGSASSTSLPQARSAALKTCSAETCEVLEQGCT